MVHPRLVACSVLVLTAMTAPVVAQDQPSDRAALEQEVRDLRQAVLVLQARLDAVENAAAASQSGPTTPATTAQASAATNAAAPGQIARPQQRVEAANLPERNTIADELTGVARADTAAPPNDPQLRGFIPIPGTETMVKLGGFAKVNAIYDFGPAGNTDKLVTATIPIDGGDAHNANLDANATRFSFDVRRPSSLGPLRFYLENDFYGGSGVTAFRLRQAHGQVGNTYAGYGYSAFTDSDAFPETLDDEGPGGEALLRVAAIRQIWKLGGGATATLSVEDPASDITLAADQAATQPAPDVTAAVRIERHWGHVQSSVLLRQLGYRQGDRDESAFGYGLSLSALAKVGDDFLMAGATYGDGVSRYFNDLGGRGYDGAIDTNGDLKTLSAYGGYLGLTRHWNARWRSNLVGGMVMLDRDDLLAPSAFRSSRYGAANLIWAVSPNFSVGLEALYGRHELQDGRAADVTRLQASFKYDFVR